MRRFEEMQDCIIHKMSPNIHVQYAVMYIIIFSKSSGFINRSMIVGRGHRYLKNKEYRLLKFCRVPATSAISSKAFSLFCVFLLQPLTVLMKQTRQVVHAIMQSTLLRCLWSRVSHIR